MRTFTSFMTSLVTGDKKRNKTLIMHCERAL